MEKQTNVLVLVPRHPVDIVTADRELNEFRTEKNKTFSTQMMALLGEETFQGEPSEKEKDKAYLYNQPYGFWDSMFLNTMVGNKVDSPSIFFGNIPKHMDNITFQHIISLEEYKDEEKWKYDEELKKAYGDKTPLLYSVSDVQFFFPTWRHLRLFLTTLGFERSKESESK